MERLTAFALAMVCMLSITMSTLAADSVDYSSNVEGKVVSEKVDSFGNEIIKVVTGDIVEVITITENGVVFVNGKNITTITPVESKAFSKGARALSDWEFAGTYAYHYDLSDLTVTAGAGIIKKLGKTISKKTILAVAGNYITKSIFQQGRGFEDIRDHYYKNINQQRPDMKEVHTVNFYFELFGDRQYEKYLCGFTTYA